MESKRFHASFWVNLHSVMFNFDISIMSLEIVSYKKRDYWIIGIDRLMIIVVSLSRGKVKYCKEVPFWWKHDMDVLNPTKKLFIKTS